MVQDYSYVRRNKAVENGTVDHIPWEPTFFIFKGLWPIYPKTFIFSWFWSPKVGMYILISLVLSSSLRNVAKETDSPAAAWWWVNQADQDHSITGSRLKIW